MYSSGSDYLTLVTTPYTDPEHANKYVGMGYWQRNALSGSDQQTYFSSFTYGFGTPSAGMPRTGAAHWLTDIFGLLTVPDSDIRTIQGQGDFDVDFSDGSFRALGSVTEYDFITNEVESNHQDFEAAGKLGSGNAFSGVFTYVPIYVPNLFGTISGNFYGPHADEVGASFQATGDGSVLTGAFTGQNSTQTAGGEVNLSLSHPLGDEWMASVEGSLYWEQNDGASVLRYIDPLATSDGRTLLFGKNGVESFAFGYDVNAADRVPDARPNFTTYQTTSQGIPTTVSLYKIGNSNSEIQLTYTSLFEETWTDHHDVGSYTSHDTIYGVYGIDTPSGVLAALTGTASYSGVAYGAGATKNGTLYDVNGLSHFEVNFSDASYSGWLQLEGLDQGGNSRDFGKWTFDSGVAGHYGGAALIGPVAGSPTDAITPTFYGPTASEIGANFALTVSDPQPNDSVNIVGVTVAKQH